jgi:hypothetical protein
MPSTAPLGQATTVVMAVDSTSRISLYGGGDKLSEQAIDPADPPLTVQTLSFGATDPGGLQPGAILLEQVSLWTIPLIDQYGALYSGNLNWTQPVENTPKPVVSIPTALSVREGDTLQIPVTKSGAGACTVQLRTIGASATTPVDYTGFLSPVTFGVNDTVVNVPLPTIADAPGVDAGDETLRLELSLAGSTDATLGNSSATITILEPPRVSVPISVSVREGNVLSLIVSKAGTGACSVTWRTLSGTGPTGATVASGDYTGVSATTLSFSASETQKTVTVTTLTDAVAEGPETFSILLENPTGCTITTGTCTVTILDPNAPEEPEQTALTVAVGFASAANCGLGYPIYKVTTLANSGTGSLRDACSVAGRMIIFEIAGRIVLTPGRDNRLDVKSNITIAGETAPAPGITVQGNEVKTTGSNVRISHITFERGYSDDVENGQLNSNVDVAKIAEGTARMTVNGQTVVWEGTPTVTSNIHFYHCAFYWGSDETVQHWPSLSRRIDGISYHDCIFAEPLWKPSNYDSTLANHWKVDNKPFQAQHNYGVLFGYGTKRADMQYCLFCDMDMREPFVDHTTSIVLANMIASNCRKGATIQQNPNPGAFLLTVKGYLCISGPNTGSATTYGGLQWLQYADQQPDGTAVFAEKLYGWKGGADNNTYNKPQEKVLIAHKDSTGKDIQPYWLNGTTKVLCMVNSAPIDTEPATKGLDTPEEIYDRAVLNVGPRPKEIRALIAGDTTIGNKNVARTIKQLKNKTGKWVNHQDEDHAGGFYKPTSVTRTFTSTATFPDGTLIGLPPAGAATPTATGRANQKAWLRKFLDRIQND